MEEVFAHESYPDSPTKVGRIDHLDVTRNIDNNYALRYQSYFIAPQSGNYRFIATCDNQCNIYLSTNAEEKSKKEIISITSYTSYHQWDK